MPAAGGGMAAGLLIGARESPSRSRARPRLPVGTRRGPGAGRSQADQASCWDR